MKLRFAIFKSQILNRKSKIFISGLILNRKSKIFVSGLPKSESMTCFILY